MNADVAVADLAASPVIESFGRAARNYARHATVQATMAAWLAEWLPSERAGRALEIGAGQGGFTRWLLPWRGALLATDLSPRMCAVGRAVLPHVTWRVMAAEQPAHGPWDWMFCSSMLQWAEEPARLFAAWHEQLAPSGRLLAGMFIDESLPELRAQLGEDGPVRWRTAAEWGACLARGGFNIVRAESARRVLYHGSALELLRSLHGVGAAPTRRMGPGRLRRLLQDYEASHRSAAGVQATWTFFRCEAVRR